MNAWSRSASCKNHKFNKQRIDKYDKKGRAIDDPASESVQLREKLMAEIYAWS